MLGGHLLHFAISLFGLECLQTRSVQPEERELLHCHLLPRRIADDSVEAAALFGEDSGELQWPVQEAMLVSDVGRLGDEFADSIAVGSVDHCGPVQLGLVASAVEAESLGRPQVEQPAHSFGGYARLSGCGNAAHHLVGGSVADFRYAGSGR